MYIDKLMNKFGYSEMYEWSELFEFNIVPYGRFVSFDNNEPGKIKLANNYDNIIGVTTQIIYTIILESYDDINEMPYVATYKDSEVVPVVNDTFDKSRIYKKRSERPEWVRVNLLGKCIVVDDGNCKPGGYCTVSKEGGIAVPCDYIEPKKYYVIDRLTDNTIMIFFK